MEVRETCFDGVLLVSLRIHSDDRGFFCETYKEHVPRLLAPSLPCSPFIQDNLVFSKSKGTIRGLHFQKEPYDQAKLICVLSGKIMDVVLDIREDSPTFGFHGWFPLHAIGSHPYGQALYIPAGLAHGYQTLEDGCLVAYKVDSAYSPDHEAGIRWDDPILSIDWPIKENVTVSEKDRGSPGFFDTVRKVGNHG